MSYWRLEKRNLLEPAILFPIIPVRMSGAFIWADLLRFHRFTLWVLLLSNVPVLVLLALAAWAFSYGALGLIQTVPSYSLAFAVFAVAAVFGLFNILSAASRLGCFLIGYKINEAPI
jgi:hypothetical protein